METHDKQSVWLKKVWRQPRFAGSSDDCLLERYSMYVFSLPCFAGAACSISLLPLCCFEKDWFLYAYR
ncbi:hypothetical protein M514_01164 [Trichuris suis]|uniref:Uncharacterized protein n=1 Tax=Trichuris suis TaxID=68888 RepID=A0A085ML35_9BILA|nr:hypothetical protein M513_01164 [Trichuris suis]KFD70890.1 hypothetical protein M514_01164 [Trichuris suis]KHJ45795.1 hypothetical protein D918_04007 [Trichuris suis]